MDKVNQYAFYEFGAALGHFREIGEGAERQDLVLAVWSVEMAIIKFLKESAHVPLRLSKLSAEKLEKALGKIYGMTAGETDWERKVTKYELSDVHKALDDFEVVLSSEAQGLEVFSIPQQCAYSTTTLIEDGENVLPLSVRDFMSAYAKEEMHEAGRCIAFDLPTAAGFHMMRSMESVLHCYWDIMSGGKPKPKLQNGNDAPMGVYISDVAKEGANPKVIGILRQIKDLHRNPIMHPDVVMGGTEAITLLGVVTSAISAMVEEMKRKGLTPPASS